VVALSESGAQKIKSIYPSRTTTILLKACRSTLISRIYDRAPIAFQELQWRLKDSLNPLSGGFDYTIDANQPFEQVCFLVDKILADLRSVKFKMVTP